ncbi:MAG: thioesterase family protein [Synechococcales cyanobacterium]
MSFVYERWIHIGDTDCAGIVYFTQHLHICHEAYEAWMRAGGIHPNDFGQDRIVPIVHSEMDYKYPLRWGDCCHVHLSAREVTAQGFSLHYTLMLPTYPRPAASGHTRHVCINPQTRRRQSLPDSLQRWLEQTRDP